MTPGLIKRAVLTGAAGLAIVLSSPVAARRQAGPAVETEGWPGAVSRSVTTRAGRITLRLPDDIRAGDTISGTVLAEPTGSNERERQRNAATLNGTVIEIGGQRAARNGNVIRFTVPATGLTRLLLKSAANRTLGSALLNIGPALSAAPDNAPPLFAQPGEPMTVPGNFDGNASNTSLMIGERPIEIIAESPRGVVVLVPPGAVGSQTLSVNEAQVQRSVAMTSIAVNLSAPKLTLVRGETTQLTVQVSGLQGQPPNPPLRLALVGSAAIRLEGGNAQSLTLTPDAAGSAVIERQITGVLPGGFEVSGQVMAQQAAPRIDPLFPDALDMTGIDSAKELLALIASMNDDARVALLRATLRALRQRLSDAGDDDTREWLTGKIGIVEAAMDTLGVSR